MHSIAYLGEEGLHDSGVGHHPDTGTGGDRRGLTPRGRGGAGGGGGTGRRVSWTRIRGTKAPRDQPERLAQSSLKAEVGVASWKQT